MGVEHALTDVHCSHHEIRGVIARGQYADCSLRVGNHLVLLAGERGKCRYLMIDWSVHWSVLTLGFAMESLLLEKSKILDWRHSVSAEYAALVVVGRCSPEGNVEVVLGSLRHLLEGRFRRLWNVTVGKE